MFTYPALCTNPFRVFSQSGPYIDELTNSKDLTERLIACAGSPFEADYRKRFLQGFADAYADLVESLFPNWLKACSDRTPQDAVRLAAGLTVLTSPALAALFCLSVEKHAPELTEIFRETAKRTGGQLHPLLEFAAAKELETPRTKGIELRSGWSACLYLLETVNHGRWNITELLLHIVGALDESDIFRRELAKSCAAMNRAAQARRWEAFLESEKQDAVITEKAYAVSRRFISVPEKVFVLLETALTLSGKEDESRLRVLIFLFRHMPDIRQLIHDADTGSFEDLNQTAEKLKLAADAAGIDYSLVRVAGMPIGRRITAVRASQSAYGRAAKTPKLISPETAVFLGKTGGSPIVIDLWRRGPDAYVEEVVRCLGCGRAAPMDISIFPAEVWRTSYCRVKGLTCPKERRIYEVEAAWAFRALIPNFHSACWLEAVRNAGPFRILAMASELPVAAAAAYREALVLLETRSEAISLMGSVEWLRAGGPKLHAPYFARREVGSGRTAKDFVTDVKDCLAQSRTEEERDARSGLLLMITAEDLKHADIGVISETVADVLCRGVLPYEKAAEVFGEKRLAGMINDGLSDEEARQALEEKTLPAELRKLLRDRFSKACRTFEETVKDILTRRRESVGSYHGYSMLRSEKSCPSPEEYALLKLLMAKNPLVATERLTGLISVQTLEEACRKASELLTRIDPEASALLTVLRTIGLSEISRISLLLKHPVDHTVTSPEFEQCRRAAGDALRNPALDARTRSLLERIVTEVGDNQENSNA